MEDIVDEIELGPRCHGSSKSRNDHSSDACGGCRDIVPPKENLACFLKEESGGAALNF